MAVKVHYLEPGLIHVRWINKVTVPEVDEGVKEVDDLVNQAGDQHYLEIIDLRECSAIPFDLRGLRRIATHDPRIIGYVAVQPSHVAKTMASMLAQVTGLPFRVVTAWDEALDEARAMVTRRLSAR